VQGGVRLALVGAGGVAQSKYLPALARLRTIWEPVDVVVFAEPRQDQAEKVSRLWGARAYADHEEMLAREDVDGVLVLSPDPNHAQHAIAALEANRHVLVEKPITRSLVEGERLCQLAEERNRVLMTVANWRHTPAFRRAKQLIEHGPVRDPALIVGKFNLGYDYVDLLESGTIHLLDIMRYLAGDVMAVSAVAINKYKRHSLGYPIDALVASMEFVSRRIGSLHTSSEALSFKPWMRVEVYGDHAWLCVEDLYELLLYDDEEGPAKSWKPALTNTLLFDEEFGGYMGLVENFLQAVRGDEQPSVSGWDGYRAYELVVACHLAVARKARVSLPLIAKSADEEVAEWLKNSTAAG